MAEATGTLCGLPNGAINYVLGLLVRADRLSLRVVCRRLKEAVDESVSQACVACPEHVACLDTFARAHTVDLAFLLNPILDQADKKAVLADLAPHLGRVRAVHLTLRPDTGGAAASKSQLCPELWRELICLLPWHTEVMLQVRAWICP